MATELKKLKLMELSLVDRPANAQAVVNIFKRDEEAGPSGDINPDDTGENLMPDNTQKLEELQKSFEELQAKLEKAEAEKDDLVTLSKMSDAEKAYMNGMSDDEKKKFMGLSADERAKKMNDMKKNDETVEVEGQTISKSAVGAEVFSVFKAQAERIASIEKKAEEDRKEAEQVKLEKRAADELPNLAGTVQAKAKLLKSIGDDEDALQVLKAAEAAAAKAGETHGFTKAKDVDGETAEDLINKKAAEIEKRDGISKSEAIAKAWQENPDMYERYEQEKVA